jgi:hypothetical protein
MRGTTVRRWIALASIVATGGLMAACTPTGPITAPTVPTGNFQFKGKTVTVNSSNDKTCVLGICANTHDEPYIINIAFSVKFGVPGSATTSVVTGNETDGIGEGETHTLTGGEQATTNLSNVPLLDVADLAWTTNHLAISGVWSWAMESDVFGVGGIASTAADAIRNVLNTYIANSASPTDASAIINILLDAIGDNIFPALGSFLGSIVPFLGDDGIGSRFYVGIGARGTLASILDSAIGGTSFPSLAIPVVKVPPDIDGGAIFTLGNKTFTNQVMTNSGVDGKHTYSFSLSQV